MDDPNDPKFVGFDSDDPYDVAALLYTFFACESCRARIEWDWSKPVNWHAFGQQAKEAGWMVPSDHHMFCSACRSLMREVVNDQSK